MIESIAAGSARHRQVMCESTDHGGGGGNVFAVKKTPQRVMNVSLVAPSELLSLATR